MFTENTTHYFLGANTPTGFYSLYDHLNSPETHDLLYIIKGGPGCGKSTFMKKIGQAAQGGVEYIHCSGDPDSLDAVILKKHRLAYADGTSPHVLEPTLPAVTEQYLNFGNCYNMSATKARLSDISLATMEYKSLYERAYHFICAAGELRKAMLNTVDTPSFRQKAEKRTNGIIRREVPHRNHPGGGHCFRFLSGLTCNGEVTLWNTVTDNYNKVFQLLDNYGLSHRILSPLASAFESAGYYVTLCLCHNSPERIRHLLVPELSVAFVTSTATDPFPGKAYRRIHVDAMSENTSSSTIRQMRKELRILTDNSVSALKDAKNAHDHLEALYRPCIDFTAVDAITEAHISAINA